MDFLKEKYNKLSLVACCAIFAAFVFTSFVYYMKRESRMIYLDWDMNTITVGDYSVEYKISNEAYNWFLVNQYQPHDERSGISPGESLKNYMKSEIERIMNEELDKEHREHGENASIKIQQVKVADIVFAFNNERLITLLKERGKYIMNQQYDKMRETEKKINDLKN